MSKRKERRFVPDDTAEEFLGSILRGRAAELQAWLMVGFCLYLLLSLMTFAPAPITPPGVESELPRSGLQNAGGSFGYLLSAGLLYVFGAASYVLVCFYLGFAVLRLCGRPQQQMVIKTLGVVVFTALCAVLLAGPAGLASGELPEGLGGRFGAVVSPRLDAVFGGPGRILLLFFGLVLAFLVATEWAFSQLLWDGLRLSARGLQRVRFLQPALAGIGLLEEEAPSKRGGKARSKGGRKSGSGASKKSSKKAPKKAAVEEPEDEEVEEELGEDEEWVYEYEEVDPDEELGEDEEWEYVDEEDEEAEEEPEPVAEEAAAKKGGKKGKKGKKGKNTKAAEEPVVELPPPPKPKKKPEVKINRPKRAARAQQALPFDEVYPFPPIDLFQETTVTDGGISEEQVRKNAAAIERRLGSFKIESHVVGVAPGPAVTQYELRLAEGIKVSKINSYEADLAAALKAVSVRVVAPIPGRDTVGIEVPNNKRQMVVLRELLECGKKTEDFGIPLYLGRDVAGDTIIEDLAKMPHLLIAGTTGSGKSVCINTILLSILMTRTPRQVRLILIDPKMVELQTYSNVPHLACPVVTSMKKAPGVLDWAVEEMEKRYALLSAVRCNHIRSYNKLGQPELEKRLGREVPADEVELPYMVVVIDELADLMNVAAKEVEEHIQRLAQKSRAVGIHVILATQRPSTDVVTGIIKANLPCTIGFKVNRKIDSRVILDSNGAEKLLGHGDMLYIGPQASSTSRAQGAFVSEEEIHRVVDYLEEQGARQSFIPDLVQTQTASKRSAKQRDDLYEQAVEVVLGQQRGSATLLQRALSVGYTRATRLLELMEEDGLVGPYNGSKSREVHMTIEEWQAQEEAIEDELAAVAEAGVELDAEAAEGGDAGLEGAVEDEESASLRSSD